MVGLPWLEQRNTVSAEFSVFAVKPAITIFFFSFFLILCVGVVKLELVSLIETPVISQTLKVRSR